MASLDYVWIMASRRCGGDSSMGVWYVNNGGMHAKLQWINFGNDPSQ